jgi:hypothetical protein
MIVKINVRLEVRFGAISGLLKNDPSTPAFFNQSSVSFQCRDELQGLIGCLAAVRFNREAYCLLDGCWHLI